MFDLEQFDHPGGSFKRFGLPFRPHAAEGKPHSFPGHIRFGEKCIPSAWS